MGKNIKKSNSRPKKILNRFDDASRDTVRTRCIRKRIVNQSRYDHGDFRTSYHEDK